MPCRPAASTVPRKKSKQVPTSQAQTHIDDYSSKVAKQLGFGECTKITLSFKGVSALLKAPEGFEHPCLVGGFPCLLPFLHPKRLWCFQTGGNRLRSLARKLHRNHDNRQNGDFCALICLHASLVFLILKSRELRLGPSPRASRLLLGVLWCSHQTPPNQASAFELHQGQKLHAKGSGAETHPVACARCSMHDTITGKWERDPWVRRTCLAQSSENSIQWCPCTVALHTSVSLSQSYVNAANCQRG